MSFANVGLAPVSHVTRQNPNGQVSRSESTTNTVSTQRQQVLQEQREQLRQRIQIRDLERFAQASNRRLRFVMEHDSNQVLVKVIDGETDRVIREIPPEEMQRLLRSSRDAIGILLDEMV